MNNELSTTNVGFSVYSLENFGNATAIQTVEPSTAYGMESPTLVVLTSTVRMTVTYPKVSVANTESPTLGSATSTAHTAAMLQKVFIKKWCHHFM